MCLLKVTWWVQFLLCHFLALQKILFNVSSWRVMILVLFAQVHQGVATVSVGDRCGVESLVVCGRWRVVIYALVYWTVYALTLSLSGGFELPLWLGDQWLVELLAVFACHSVFDHALSRVGDWLRLGVSSAGLFDRSGQWYFPIVDRSIESASFGFSLHVTCRLTQLDFLDVGIGFFLYALDHFRASWSVDTAHHLWCVDFVIISKD